MDEVRTRIVREAREWIGTPYHHGARLKGIAADCTFVAVVYANCGVMPHIEIKPYSPQQHLNRGGGVYIDIVRKFAVPTNDPLPGDLIMYWFGRDFSHGAIIVDPGYPTIIHGDISARAVILDRANDGRLGGAKKTLAFTFLR